MWCLWLLVALLLLGGCSSKIVVPEPVSDSGSQMATRVVKSAQSQKGVRYRMGGTTPKMGFDCSGLILWAYAQHGVKVPRITKDQARAGSRVSRSEMRTADILVFRTRSGPTGLHTALYVGNGRFVHSPSRGRTVCIDSLQDSYWGPRLIEVRRILR